MSLSEEEKKQEFMKKLWDQLPKEKSPEEKECIRYIATDPQYLYGEGFVDTDRFTLEDWKNAFAPFVQKNGSFLIPKEAFLELARFKYEGPVYEPFDPDQMKEGWYTLESWHAYSRQVILPCTILPETFLTEVEKFAKTQGLIVENKINLSKELILGLKEVLKRYPSPRYRRELATHEARKELHKTGKSPQGALLQSQKSLYNKGPVTGKTEKKDLSELLLKKTSSSEEAPAASKNAGLSLKDLRKQNTRKQGV